MGRRAGSADREDRQLLLELATVAVRALGFRAPVDDRLKLLVAVLADVLKDRHSK